MALNANCVSISNAPFCSFPKHIPYTEKAALDERGIVSQNCLYERTRGEYPCRTRSESPESAAMPIWPALRD